MAELHAQRDCSGCGLTGYLLAPPFSAKRLPTTRARTPAKRAAIPIMPHTDRAGTEGRQPGGGVPNKR
jgi:hypothetical protein